MSISIGIYIFWITADVQLLCIGITLHIILHWQPKIGRNPNLVSVKSAYFGLSVEGSWFGRDQTEIFLIFGILFEKNVV